MLVWHCRVKWKGHITTVKLHWPPHLCKQCWIQQTNTRLLAGGNSCGLYLSCIWHSATVVHHVWSISVIKYLYYILQYWLKMLNHWFKHIFLALFGSLCIPVEWDIHLVSQNAFQWFWTYGNQDGIQQLQHISYWLAGSPFYSHHTW